MALSQLYTAITGDVITAARWNNEFGNIYSNALSLISPLTGTLNANSNNITNVVNLAFAASGSITGTCQISTTTVGPHAIGGALNADVGLLITGAQATGTAMGVQISSTTIPATGESSYGLNIIPTLTEFSSGVHSLLAGVSIDPTVTAGAGTVTTLAGLAIATLTAQTGTTNAASIYIVGAPTGATNNYALWLGSGNIRMTGSLGPNVAPQTTGPSVDLSTTTSLTFRGGTTNTVFRDNSGGTALVNIGDAGIVTISVGPLLVSTAAPAIPAAKSLYEDSIIKGWVDFNTAGGINDDLNVSSITDNGVGDWTINWAVGFTGAQYSVTCAITVDPNALATIFGVSATNTITTGACRVLSSTVAGVLTDPTGTTPRMFVTAIGNN